MITSKPRKGNVLIYKPNEETTEKYIVVGDMNENIINIKSVTSGHVTQIIWRFPHYNKAAEYNSFLSLAPKESES